MGEKKNTSLMVAQSSPVNNTHSGPAPVEHTYKSAMITCFPIFLCVYMNCWKANLSHN